MPTVPVGGQRVPFSLAAIADEISSDLAEALSVMVSEGVTQAEIRSVAKKNVSAMDDADIRQAVTVLREHGCTVSGVASPIGKSPLSQDRAYEEERLRRALQVASELGTDRIRIFSYYPEKGTAPERYPELGQEVLERLARLTAIAAPAGITLLLENEVDLWGDVPERCRFLLTGVDSPHLRAAWDPDNYYRSGVERPFTDGWPHVAGFVACAHVKDCDAQHHRCPAGAGVGQWPELMAQLAAQGGIPLVLEPHMARGGQFGGFSGADAFRRALAGIRSLLAAVGRES